MNSIMRQWHYLATAVPILLFIISCGKKYEAPEPAPPGVVCSVAVKQDISVTHEHIGQIVAEEVVDLVARVEGFLVKRNFEEGSFVKNGDLIFEIDPSQYEAQAKEAEGQLTKAQSALVYANIQAERYTTLVKQDAVAQKELDSAIMQLGTSKGDVLVAQGQLDLAKINLGYTKITAPFDGKLGVCPISVGNFVGPTINNNLGKIVRIDPVKVEFNVPEHLIVSILQRDGSMAKAEADIIPRIALANGTEYPIDGNIYFSNNEVNISTGTMLIRARFPNPNGILTAGEYVKVRLIKKTKTPSILIPAIAIQRDQVGEFVFVVDKDSKVQRRTVKTGQLSGLSIVILEGLSEGENVIVQGVLKARPGMAVTMTTADDGKNDEKSRPVPPPTPATEKKTGKGSSDKKEEVPR
jgi:membrane fusion protein (multidrug efflux system)